MLSVREISCLEGCFSSMLNSYEAGTMNEADTCRTYILPKLKACGWEDEYITEQLVLTPGRIVPIGDRHTRKEGLRPDYVLIIRQNIPIAVIEAKTEYAHPGKGLQQAIQYAEMLNVKFAYSSNGNGYRENICCFSNCMAIMEVEAQKADFVSGRSQCFD